ncbi:phosphoribosylformylglycinamidine cyclo-ligase [Aerococcaceae bacterium DSM 111020]|nr:phosphoribosylformylglycinamidine cyclo-ligase [Aerococcaceae bacterium DSM 111020]
MGLDYKAAGVDKEAGYQQVQLIKEIVKRTHTPGVLNDLGGFAGAFKPELSEIEEPVLVSGTDGVGTKLMLAQQLDIHDTIGIDAVAMCVNDILCQGAQPLFFLDYIATGKNIPEKMAEIVSGVAEGCIQGHLALIGGETAEMPGMYQPEEYDIAGFAVGMVDRQHLITGSTIEAGSRVIGLPSSGIHSNGFSLVRAILEKKGIAYTDHIDGFDRSIGEILLTPTRIYTKEILSLLKKVKLQGIAHITGGGLEENVPRILPEGLGLRIDTGQIPTPLIFEKLQEWGNIDRREMFSTFNMGVGMVIVLAEEEVEQAQQILKNLGTDYFELGTIEESSIGVQFDEP